MIRLQFLSIDGFDNLYFNARLLNVKTRRQHEASMNEGMAYVRSSSGNLWHLLNFSNKLQFLLHTNKFY